MNKIIRPSQQALASLSETLNKAYSALEIASQKADAEIIRRRHIETIERAGTIAVQIGKREFKAGCYRYDSGWLNGPAIPDGTGTQLKLLRIDTVEKRLCGIPVKRTLNCVKMYSRAYDRYTKWPDGSMVTGQEDYSLRFTMHNDSTNSPAVQLADPESTNMADPNFVTITTEQQWLQVSRLLESFEHGFKH